METEKQAGFVWISHFCNACEGLKKFRNKFGKLEKFAAFTEEKERTKKNFNQ